MIFDIAPVPASRPRVGKWGTYYNKTYSDFREAMGKLLLGKRKPLAGALRTDVSFYFLLPKSYSKKKRDEMDGTYCVGVTDLDNLEKAIYDSLNGIAYDDDKQIVEHTTRKKWVKERPRIEVEIKNI